LIPVLVWFAFVIACGIAWYYWFKDQNTKAKKTLDCSLLGFMVVSLVGWVCFGLKYGV